jgi:exopolysaccharide biosynthesis protein
VRTVLNSIVLMSVLIFINLIGTFGSETISSQVKGIKSWRELSPATTLEKGVDGVPFYRFKTENGSDASLLIIDLKAKKFAIQPFFNRTASTTSDAARRLDAIAAINGGYFNLSDGESASYVVIDQQAQCNPKTNKALIGNPSLAPFLPAVYNRSEVRILSDKQGEMTVSISPHEDPVPNGYTLVHSIQAGPRLLPELTARQEAFVRTNSEGKIVDSIGCYKTAARTALGITDDDHILLLCVAGKGQKEFSSGISLPDLASLLQHLGCTEAINFDGGTSTTMVVIAQKRDQVASLPKTNSSTSPGYTQVCGQTPEKLVRSGLLVVQTPYRSKSRSEVHFEATR